MAELVAELELNPDVKGVEVSLIDCISVISRAFTGSTFAESQNPIFLN